MFSKKSLTNDGPIYYENIEELSLVNKESHPIHVGWILLSLILFWPLTPILMYVSFTRKKNNVIIRMIDNRKVDTFMDEVSYNKLRKYLNKKAIKGE